MILVGLRVKSPRGRTATGDDLPLLMGLDVGTTGCKASIFDDSGNLRASAYREYPLICPKPAWAELDPQIVYRRVAESIREAVVGLDVRAEDVEAVAVSSQGEAFLPVSKKGQPLYNSIVTPDQRAQEQTGELKETFGSRWLFEKTGMVLFPIYTLNKIMWLRDNVPKVFRTASKFLCWEDYVNFRLTGSAVIDLSLANRTMMFDIKRGKWSDELLSEVGLSMDLLADLSTGGTPVGEVTAQASRETGLASGTLVVAGGHDQACGCLGAGVVDEGPLYDVTGTVECIMPAVKEPVLTEGMLDRGYGNYCHVVPNRYLILGYNMTAGTILRWFRDLFADREATRATAEGRSVYSVLDSMAAEVPPGSEGLFVLPYFMGAATPNWDTSARGTLVGLTLAHGKGHIVRAIMEGITFELRNNLEALAAEGIPNEEIRAVGGGAKSEFWCQLKADITERPVRVPSVSEASSLGAAILAGVGSGAYGSHEEAIARTYAVKGSYDPRPSETYRKAFEVYREIYERLSTVFPEFASP